MYFYCGDLNDVQCHRMRYMLSGTSHMASHSIFRGASDDLRISTRLLFGFLLVVLPRCSIVGINSSLYVIQILIAVQGHVIDPVHRGAHELALNEALKQSSRCTHDFVEVVIGRLQPKLQGRSECRGNVRCSFPLLCIGAKSICADILHLMLEELDIHPM